MSEKQETKKEENKKRSAPQKPGTTNAQPSRTEDMRKPDRKSRR